MADIIAEESDFSWRKIRITLTVMIGIGLGTTFLLIPAYPLTLPAMTHEFGWKPSEYGFAFSLLLWFGACSGPFLGWIVDRVGVRPMIIGGTVVVGLIGMSLSKVGSLTHFYVCFALLGVFGSTAIGYGKVIGALFTKHRGKAMALLGVESSLAGAVIPQAVQWLINHQGWRGAYFWLGVVTLCVAPLIYFSLEEPGRVGGARQGPVSAPPPALVGMTAGEVYRTGTFWALVAAHVLGGLALGVVGTYMVPMLMAHGFAQADGANFQTILVLAGACGTLAAGFLLDHTRSAKICAPFCAISAVSLVMLATVSAQEGGRLMFWVMAILYGFGAFARLPMGGYFQTRFFGLKAFAAVSGVQGAVMAGFFGFGSPLVGKSQEATGSYDGALWVLAGATALAGVIYLFLGPYRYPATAVLATPEPQRAPIPATAGAISPAPP
ncbi:MAG TPA: MFS transporter [Steroidobacteraceae bacterium]|nr:MFS transporter [Steroidobacteraceae bacterium]